MQPTLIERSFNLNNFYKYNRTLKIYIISQINLISQKQNFLNIIKINSKLYPSRILNLGIYILISNSKDFKEKNENEMNKIISDIFEKLNLSPEKAEKDIGIYKSGISKMKQAKELIEELRIKDKKKSL